MSALRSSRQRNGKKADGEKYSRADEALWDDAYLLKLFNEQLDNPDTVKDNRDSESESAASSEPEEVEEEEEDSRSASAITSSSAASGAVAAVPSNAAAAASPAHLPISTAGFPATNGLPAELQGLVQSFYNAGFEAGRYVGRAETAAGGAPSRKRPRMRGNPYSRGFDPMKSRSERRKEKQAKLSKTKRVIRLKKRLGRIAARKFAGQEDSHMTALMESYITRRKAERAAEKAKQDPESAAAAGSSGGAADEEDFGSEESEDGDDGGSDAFSLGSGADSAFEMDVDDEQEEEEGEESIAASRRRAAQRKQQQQQRGGPARGRGRGGAASSWAAKKDGTGFAGKRGGGRGRGHGSGRGSGDTGASRGGRGGAGSDQRGFSRGRGGVAGQRGGRGGRGAAGQRTASAARFLDRSRKVPTRSLY